MQESTYKEILKKNGLSGKDVAGLLGLSYQSYRTLTRRKAEPPRWIKAFMLGYTLSKTEDSLKNAE